MGSSRSLRLLLEQGANLTSEENRGVLAAATMSGYSGLLRALLDAGMPIDAVDDKGRTALIQAVRRCDMRLVKRLLERGADT